MHVWRREGSDVSVERAPFSPIVLATDRSLVADAAGLTSLDRLDGPGDLAWLACFDTWGHAIGARDRCRERATTAPGDPTPPFLFPGDAVHQFQLTTGRTSFDGMVFGDLRRLALDIEVMTTDGFEFPSAARPGDRIIAIALADSTGYVEVLRGDRLDERALLEACTAAIRARDPDVVEGHNIFRFDLEYLEARARLHGVTLAWGRDGSVLRGRPTRLAIAERTIGYRRYEIGGRHIVDTWMLAQLHDAGTRNLPAFGLKDLARHFGVVAEDRTYVEGADITAEFRDAPDRLMAYAADDVQETLGIGRILAPPYFAQAQLVPFDYQSTVLRGAAAKIDALLLRDYLRARHAVPRPRPPAPVGGGHVAIFHQGVARDVLHVDVTSLYPSLMIARGIAPASDSLGAFLTLLGTLRDFRMQAKRDAREATDPERRAHLAALQQSFKILINAFYGYLAFSNAHWNDFAAADRVTADGRDVVATILAELDKAGAVPLEADTDGVYFVPPPGHTPADDDALLARVAATLPPGIQLELDGRHAAMFSYRLKTYALLDAHGRVTLRGSAFRSRGLEPFQRRLIEELVRRLLEERGAECKRVVERWLDDFANHRVPPRLFARTETLQESLEAYRAKLASGGRSVSAVYELAIASGRPMEPGDQISYYVAGRSARVAVNEHARLMAAWDPARPDENVEYYQTKVLEVWERLRPFAEQPGLRPWVDEAPAVDPQLSLF